MFKKAWKNSLSNEPVLKQEVRLIEYKPESFAEVKEGAMELRNGNSLLVDLNALSKLDTIRVIDFLSGVVFATNGGYKKVERRMYLLSASKDDIDAIMNEIQSEDNE